ncbi:MAG TPA: Flp family type IVb pilin [Tepidisphaeraceae bacterium]|jgi:Flp pilus assembly pilin Flp|nr:Flp family type IVb pilin [Tepidisphaeraceae bacterium]
MKISVCKLCSLGKRLAGDENGAEVMEYVLILGLIVVVTIVTITAFGTKVLAKWTSVNRSM